MDLFKKKENKLLKDINLRLSVDKHTLTIERDEYRQKYKNALSDADTLRTEIKELKKKLRDQNDADLYLAAQKIQKDILETGKPKDENNARYQQLLAQRQALGSSLASCGAAQGLQSSGLLGHLI